MFDDSCDWSFSTDSRDIAVESWERMLSTTHLDWSIDELFWRQETFSASVRRRALGDLWLVDCECDPSAGTRGATEIAAAGDEYFVLLMTLTGNERVEQNDASAILQPGAAVLWDSAIPAAFQVGSRLRKRSLFVPKATLAEYGTHGRLSLGRVLHIEQPAMRVLANHLDSIAGTIDSLPLQSIAAVRNATLELLSAAIVGDSSTQMQSPQVLLMRAQQFIEGNLRDPRLDPSAVAHEIGVSVRTLHRLFTETTTGVAELIRLQRLAAARDDILSGTTVTRAAQRWQFSDPSHFTRSFKRQYGLTPRSLMTQR